MSEPDYKKMMETIVAENRARAVERSRRRSILIGDIVDDWKANGVYDCVAYCIALCGVAGGLHELATCGWETFDNDGTAGAEAFFTPYMTYGNARSAVRMMEDEARRERDEA